MHFNEGARNRRKLCDRRGKKKEDLRGRPCLRHENVKLYTLFKTEDPERFILVFEVNANRAMFDQGSNPMPWSLLRHAMPPSNVFMWPGKQGEYGNEIHEDGSGITDEPSAMGPSAPDESESKSRKPGDDICVYAICPGQWYHARANDKMAAKSGRGSRIFCPFRALGFVSNHVPLVTQTLGPETFVVTAVGSAFHLYNVSELAK